MKKLGNIGTYRESLGRVKEKENFRFSWVGLAGCTLYTKIRPVLITKRNAHLEIVCRELLGRKLSSRLRKDLDEISEKGGRDVIELVSSVVKQNKAGSRVARKYRVFSFIFWGSSYI